MTTRSRSLRWLVAAALAAVPTPTPSRGQDTPLYRDPSPAEGPRVDGPLLTPSPPRPGTTPPPPPPSDLGPFQPTNPVFSDAPPPEITRDPLLGIPPMPPPMAAHPMPPMAHGGDAQVRRKTTIRPPHGPLGRCHDWFHALLFGSHQGHPVATTAAKRGVFAWSSREEPPEGDPPPRFFKWPSWPAWPLRDDH